MFSFDILSFQSVFLVSGLLFCLIVHNILLFFVFFFLLLVVCVLLLLLDWIYNSCARCLKTGKPALWFIVMKRKSMMRAKRKKNTSKPSLPMKFRWNNGKRAENNPFVTETIFSSFRFYFELFLMFMKHVVTRIIIVETYYLRMQIQPVAIFRPIVAQFLSVFVEKWHLSESDPFGPK